MLCKGALQTARSVNYFVNQFTLGVISVSTRTVVGAIVSPLVLAVVWSLPAAGGMAFFQWLLFNVAICVPLFLACAAISHLLLRRNHWTRLREYVGVMFAVATVALMIARGALLQWIFGSGGSEFHFGTQVIENGRFTLGGVLLTLVEAMFGAMWLAAAFALFWVLAVRTRVRAVVDDA